MRNRTSRIECNLNIRSETVECRIFSADSKTVSVQLFTSSPLRVARVVSFVQSNRSVINCVIGFLKLSDQSWHLRINEAKIGDLKALFSGSVSAKIRMISTMAFNLTIELARLRASSLGRTS